MRSSWFISRVHTVQLRLDFDSFVISGPSTATASVAKRLANSPVVAPVAVGTVSVAESTRCLTDRFSVTSGDGLTPPTICGTNTGEHSKFFENIKD